MPFASCCLILLISFTVRLLATPIINITPSLQLHQHNSPAPASQLLALRADDSVPTSNPPTQSSFTSTSTFLPPKPLPSSSPSFNLSLTEATSPDLELRVPHTPPLSPHRHQKRAPSRPINSCPPTYHLAFSYCNRKEGLKAYVIGCATNRLFVVDNKRIEGSCSPAEICIDGVPTLPDERGYSRYIAYCVSMENFVKISETQIADAQRKFVYTPWWDRPAYKGDGGRVQAVLGDSEGRQSVYADAMGMIARNDIPIHNDEPPLTNPLATGVKGASTCRNCVDLKLENVPEGTARVEVDVFLGARTARALLFVWVDGLINVGMDGDHRFP